MRLSLANRDNSLDKHKLLGRSEGDQKAQRKLEVLIRGAAIHDGIWLS
jgi:hypothetical protein